MHDRSPQILLIEEDRTLLEITAFRLELLGYEVVAQQSAERALEWLREQLPTLIIVDHVLPGMDGIEFINRLSNDTRTSEIPIMFLSDERRPGRRAKGVQRRRGRIPGDSVRPDGAGIESRAAGQRYGPN